MSFVRFALNLGRFFATLIGIWFAAIHFNVILTWYGLALLLLSGFVLVMKDLYGKDVVQFLQKSFKEFSNGLADGRRAGQSAK